MIDPNTPINSVNTRTRYQELDTTTWERHGQTILAGLILGGIVYIASQTIDANTQIQVINVRIETLTETLKNTTHNIYSENNAINDFAIRDKQIALNTEEIKEIADSAILLERRVDKLEGKHSEP